jgi:hypothetical protein
MTAEFLLLSAAPLTFPFPSLISVLLLLRVHVVWYAHISLCHDVMLRPCQHTAELLGSYTSSKETLKSVFDPVLCALVPEADAGS